MSTTRLILALDCSPAEACQIYEKTEKYRDHPNFGGYKLSLSMLLTDTGWYLTQNAARRHVPLMWDLKLYNLCSEIERDVKLADDRQVTWLTVHYRSVVDAVAASRNVRIIAVNTLTSDKPEPWVTRDPTHAAAHGLVCHPNAAPFYRQEHGPSYHIFCPGIRLSGQDSDEHVAPVGVSEAVRNGATYVIVGRPIYQHPDPVTRVEHYLKMLELTD